MLNNNSNDLPSALNVVFSKNVQTCWTECGWVQTEQNSVIEYKLYTMNIPAVQSKVKLS